jgi:spore maturation protein CgeB
MEKQKIVMVGVLNEPQSTNVSQAKAFMDLGYEVIPVNYRTIITDYGGDYFYNTLVELVKSSKPYLVMFCKCNGFDPSIVVECTKYAKTLLWNPDVIHESMERYPEVVEHARNSTFSACTGEIVADYFQRQGVENCYHVLDGVDTDLFRPVEPVEEFKADISLIGTKIEFRDMFLELLGNAGYVVKAYGNGYEQSVYGTEFAQVCSSSRFMLSINTISDDGGYFSNRLLRYLGCKACTIHFDPLSPSGITQYFKDGKDLILFKDADELITKIKFLGNNSIARIAQSGYDIVTTKYTWHDSCKKLLELAKEFK